MLFEEIGDVQEGVPLESQINKCRLHSRQHTRDPALVNAARKRILVRSLKIYFHQLILFEDRYFCLVAIGSNHQFLTHLAPPSGR